MLLVVQLLGLYCGLVLSAAVMSNSVIPPARVQATNQQATNNSSENNPVVKRLQEVFGLSDRHRPRQFLSPPQYMLTLYASVADNSGLVKAPNPYGAKIIRSYTEKALETARRNRFSFNVSGMAVSETLLEAELHLYISKNEGPLPREIRVYQILDSNWSENQEKNRLIDVHYVHAENSIEGWQIFRVTQAVTDCLENPVSHPLIGFLVTAVSATGQPLLFHVSRRRDRHFNRQPVLVLFNDDTLSDSSATQPETKLLHTSLSLADTRTRSNDDVELPIFRQRRDLSTSASTDGHQFAGKSISHHQRNHHHRRHLSHSNECHRQELYVDFETIGWSEWIIAPKGYNAYHCVGVCSFPLGQSQKPTNHATVQSIVHEMNLVESVGQPCCVPNRLLSLSLLYYDEYDNVVLKQYGEMVADSCGCH